MPRVIQWLISRVAVIYIIVAIFCLTCVDFKMLSMRIKTRHLNDAIPDFSDMIIFSKDPIAKNGINWRPYKNYFELIVRYIPNDMTSKQLLGYVDYYSGHEQKAIDLFKNSSSIKGHLLFWSNFDLGVIYYKKQMWPQAAEYLFKAIQSNTQLALYLMQNSQVYKQIFISHYFRYSLNDEINDALGQAYILLLSSLYHMGQFDKMVYIANLGIQNQHIAYKDDLYYNAGLGFYQGGQVEKAFLLFQKSLEFEKGNPDVYYYMADILQHAGQLTQAQALIQTSYALHQKNDPRFPYEDHINLRFF